MSRSDRSDVGCSHAQGCPLFPLLSGSLGSWRSYYCDSTDRWLGCARYKVSLSGNPVPIALLPNGHTAQHLVGDAQRIGLISSADDAATVGPLQASWPPHDAGPHDAGPHESGDRFGPVSTCKPAPPSSPPRITGSQRPRRRWWQRFADWMKGPA